MKQIRFSKTVVSAAALVLCAALLALLGLWALAHYDNKYIEKACITQVNVTILPESGISFLVDGWELYPDQLLTPTDFSEGTTAPRYTTWAGEWPNLAAFHVDGTPYGTATYRLRLQGTGTASLYLQEPLCAARVFVDGVDLGGPGEVAPEHYRPLIRDTVYAFAVNGTAEVIVQTANHSHYYGGLWFPPAIGSPDAVSHLIASRMVFYGLLCFSALALALFCAALWLGKKERRDPAAFYFGALCLSFALRVCYPFLRLWGVPLVRPLYALEDAAALLGLYCAVRIALLLFLPEKWKRLRSTAATVSLGMCGVAVVIPLLVLPAFPGFTPWYGELISWYKVAAAVFLVGAALCGCALGRPHARIVLPAVTANGVCLLWGVLEIGSFEPIVGGWPEEYGALCMVLTFTALMVRRSRTMLEENLRLREHLQEEVEEKTRHLSLMHKERDQIVAELNHDIKGPLTSVSNIAQLILMNDILLDVDTREKLQGIEGKCDMAAGCVRSIQGLMEETSVIVHMKLLDLNKFLSEFHRSNQPVVEMAGPDFFCSLTPLPCQVLADSEKLSRALVNLVLNASDFTPPEGKITLSLERDDNFAYIRVADTGCGIPTEALPNVFSRTYTTRADQGGQGLGLTIIRSIVLEHRGEITVESTVGKGTAFTIRLPLANDIGVLFLPV